jgi:hypothetical protein
MSEWLLVVWIEAGLLVPVMGFAWEQECRYTLSQWEFQDGARGECLLVRHLPASGRRTVVIGK